MQPNAAGGAKHEVKAEGSQDVAPSHPSPQKIEHNQNALAGGWDELREMQDAYFNKFPAAAPVVKREGQIS